MNTKHVSVTLATACAFTFAEVVHHGSDKSPHLPEAPAPILMPQLVSFVTSAQALPRNAREFLAQFVTQTGSGTFQLA